MAAILILMSVVSTSYYGMLRGQIHINLVIAGIVTSKYGEKLRDT